MLQVFSKDISKLILENKKSEQNISMVNSHIALCNCENMTVDITKLNLIDACTISTLCSTTHYLKYPNGKINWIVNSKEVEKYVSDMKLGNSKFLYHS
jgi:hypothetical protein